MPHKRFVVEGRQAILHTPGEICTSVRELLQSATFSEVVRRYWLKLRRAEVRLCRPFQQGAGQNDTATWVISLLKSLAGLPLEEVAQILPGAEVFLPSAARRELHDFVEGLYNYWRSFDRFMVLHSEPGPSSFDQRPYRSFNATMETLTHTVRALYRDLAENITGNHPRVYRQVSAGVDAGIIAVSKPAPLPAPYAEILGDVPFIRQVMIHPPLMIDPPMNKRTGEFLKVDDNPLAGLRLNRDEWLCYPALVGPLCVFVYFHQRFIGLGTALANLFELADDARIAAGADAVYAFGVTGDSLNRYGQLPTVFYDDPRTNLLVAAAPGEDRFGYFGYLKKMILTLHNAAMMKRGRMPYHGAMVKVALTSGRSASILILGDTAVGKSETLEALRQLGQEKLRELTIIADDMGSLEIAGDGSLRGYGTEIGAFVRLDDLQQGYAFEQMDRAIFMSPQKINSRVVLPVTRLEDILQGYPVDLLLYANNYEQVDADHPVIQPFGTAESALTVFREGAAMAKGTTTATGLVHSYFANIFGPPQYRELHEKLAVEHFAQAFKQRVFVGQLRTRLGIPGCEASGPQAAAEALLALIERTGRLEE